MPLWEVFLPVNRAHHQTGPRNVAPRSTGGETEARESGRRELRSWPCPARREPPSGGTMDHHSYRSQGCSGTRVLLRCHRDSSHRAQRPHTAHGARGRRPTRPGCPRDARLPPATPSKVPTRGTWPAADSACSWPSRPPQFPQEGHFPTGQVSSEHEWRRGDGVKDTFPATRTGSPELRYHEEGCSDNQVAHTPLSPMKSPCPTCPERQT